MTEDESYTHCQDSGHNMIATGFSEHEVRVKWLKENKPELFPSELKKRELVNQPSHYNLHECGLPAATFMNRMCANLANAFKYVYRMEHKGTRDLDINKSVWYIRNEVEFVNSQMPQTSPTGMFLHSSQIIRRQFRQADSAYMKQVEMLGKCSNDNGPLLREMINLDDYIDLESRQMQLLLMADTIENMREEDVTTG